MGDSSQGGPSKKLLQDTTAFTGLHFVVKLVRALKAYFVLDAEQSIAAVIFAEGLDAENCLHTECSGYTSATASAAAAAAAV